ncbi:MAG: cupin domain-containing protein [Paenirhodobacter sp.]|uniref:cupin domain-containing protein n=1 Tax=Paenirhodobacter sp. TaxID=1965326 RepID=UPI003D0B2E8D
MLIEALTPQGTPEITRPEAAKLVAGDPVHSTWNLEDDRGLYCGIWESTPGAWRVSYDEWEYCRILAGRSVIEGDDGSRLEVGPGDAFVLRPGFTGIWRVIETTRKDYVILCR